MKDCLTPKFAPIAAMVLCVACETSETAKAQNDIESDAGKSGDASPPPPDVELDGGTQPDAHSPDGSSGTGTVLLFPSSPPATAFEVDAKRGAVLVATTDPAAATQAFVSMSDVRKVIVSGETKSSVRALIRPELGRWDDGDQKPKTDEETDAGTVQVDLRVIPEMSWGAALMYFTGSKAHNIALRNIANARGWKLNEYGLFDGDRRIAGAST